MDSLIRRNRSNSNLIILILIIIVFLLLLLPFPSVSCTGAGIFQVHHKFFGRQRSLTALKAHDTHRHRRILSAIDLPLGGNGNPNDSGLYYAKIRLGSPPKDYYVQVDTGSDILWVNCIHCADCNKNKHTKLSLYNPKDSATGKEVSCSDDFCTNLIYDDSYPKCETDKPCAYKVLYADGSGTDGYYVRDNIQYDQPSGNAQGNASVVFGCGARQSGDLGSSSQELDGILGFGQSNTSVLSQLASSGKVKKVFSHCLDAQNGGGIFAIGQVVQPKVKTTPLVPDQPHYNVNLEEIEVGKDILDLPTDVFENGERKGTIIDSGTTLAYLPDVVYAPLIKTIMSHKPDLQLQTIEEQYQCFEYAGSVDDVFPTVTFHFKGSLTLMVYPHEYMFSTEVSHKKLWCIGWQDSSLQSKDGKYMTLLGDIVLSNKLVVYDLENQTIGWTEYNCSSSIKVLDDHSGAQYSVNAQDLSSASILEKGKISILLLLSVMMYVIHF